jgi:hypothetical protein
MEPVQPTAFHVHQALIASSAIPVITYPAALATHAETPAAQPAHPPQAVHNVAQASIFLEVAVTNVMTLDVPLAVQPTHVKFVIMDFTR